MTSEYSVFLGLDVGRVTTTRSAWTQPGKRPHDESLPNNEPKLRALFDKLATHGPLLVAVVQPGAPPLDAAG